MKRAKFLKTTIWNACCSPLAAYEKEFTFTGVQIDFSTPQKFFDCNKLLKTCRMHEMLEEKGYSNLDIVFLFIAAFLDRLFQNSEIPFLTRIYTVRFTQTL